MMSTMLILVFYYQFKPVEDPKAQKTEIFNELTMMAMLYLMVFFTDLTDEQYEFRSNLGLLFIFLVLSSVAVHVILLLVSFVKSVKRYIKRKCMHAKKDKSAQKNPVVETPDKKVLDQPLSQLIQAHLNKDARNDDHDQSSESDDEDHSSESIDEDHSCDSDVLEIVDEKIPSALLKDATCDSLEADSHSQIIDDFRSEGTPAKN